MAAEAANSDLTMSDDLNIRRRSPRLSVGGDKGDVNIKDCQSSGEKQTNNNSPKTKNKRGNYKGGCVSFLIGDPISNDEARRRWPYRYQNKRQRNNRVNSKTVDADEDELILDVKCHYSQAKISKLVFNLGDCAYVKGLKGKKNFIGRIVEFFKTMDDEDYFRVQWFFRAEDTVIEDESKSHDAKRLFLSDLMNDNPLDCIVSKVKILQVPSNVDIKLKSLSAFDFYYDMKYFIDYTTFATVVDDEPGLSSCDNMKKIQANGLCPNHWNFPGHRPHKSDMALLDLYSGCGGMSTGLCLGAKLAGVNLKTRWALDINQPACESLILNHPKVQIRNEPAEEFLGLLKEWDKLCKHYVDDAQNKTFSSPSIQRRSRFSSRKSMVSRNKNKNKNSSDEYEVASLVDICYGDPNKNGKIGLHFKVRWAGYGSSDDTWEPIEGLSNCQDRIQEFVLKGYKLTMLPRPGDVDVICGGPPCQGISGYNRHRNVDNPLDDDRNRQIVVFMDIVAFLKPIYILMENVVDILRLANGHLGKYAISRLVQLKYQASLGIMAAGCYGLPQFRLRVFLWGAHPNERLPQFPLPTHDVVLKYGAPYKFERNIVAYDEDQSPNLEKALILKDAISDLPPVYLYTSILLDMLGSADIKAHKKRCILYDHRPLKLFEDDYLRVSKIPQKKGANFRDLPGLIIGKDNIVRRDPDSNIRLPSGKQLVPDYAINFSDGKSKRPFARLWWDETIPTLLTTPDPHCQAILHPNQDRVLTVREYARLQGFPDYYRFCGTVKERYRQIGNAVAVSVAKALGYSLGKAVQKLSGNGPLMELPHKFSHMTAVECQESAIKVQESAITIKVEESAMEVQDSALKSQESAISVQESAKTIRFQESGMEVQDSAINLQESARTIDVLESAITIDVQESSLTIDVQESAITIDVQESAMKEQYSATKNQDSTINVLKSTITIDDQDSAIKIQESAINEQESAKTIAVQESAMEVQDSAINVQESAKTVSVQESAMEVQHSAINVLEPTITIDDQESAMQVQNSAIKNQESVINVQESAKRISVHESAMEVQDSAINVSESTITIDVQESAMEVHDSAIKNQESAFNEQESAKTITVQESAMEVQDSAINVQESAKTISVQESAMEVQHSAINVLEPTITIDVQESAMQVQNYAIKNQESVINVQESAETISVHESAMEESAMEVQDSAIKNQDSAINVPKSTITIDVQESAMQVQNSAIKNQESVINVQESAKRISVHESAMEVQDSAINVSESTITIDVQESAMEVHDSAIKNQESAKTIIVKESTMEVQDSTINVSESTITIDVQESAMEVQDSAIKNQDSAINVPKSTITIDVQESAMQVQNSAIKNQESVINVQESAKRISVHESAMEVQDSAINVSESTITIDVQESAMEVHDYAIKNQDSAINE
ncbi:DNA (cytosine-5)-methyltransferase CMT3-like isoform X2 [Amaranthus tricolor]|uniref:DNA (cytosine-5)-methyltransferase CMT3-like isoform X2 n=1 Tax=Amaranthus tricolor TaxID=29722 RepID=UPI00258AFCE5|nr:DNA (cytosine-5)-methyltransferase CMT3-like isoform X2 [Amaranthus tricolor]